MTAVVRALAEVVEAEGALKQQLMPAKTEEQEKQPAAAVLAGTSCLLCVMGWGAGGAARGFDWL